MVSSDVQADLAAYLKGGEKKKGKERVKERVKAALRVALFLSGDISCTDTGRGTHAALKHRPPKQNPAVVGKISANSSEVLHTAAVTSLPSARRSCQFSSLKS